MRSVAIWLVAAVACSSTSTPPPQPQPQPQPPADTPTAPPETRTPAIAADHPLYARVEGTQAANDCAADSACVVGGCSAEVCAAEQVQTTCEARDWPTRGATCGCVSGQCTWYREGTEAEPSGAGAGTDPEPDNVLREFEAISKKMCACKDSNCAETVNSEFEGWLRRNEKATGTAAEQEQAKALAETYVKCMMAAMAEAPGQGERCGANDRCGDGLTCVKYYGVAGAAGPQLSSCEIPCGKGKAACPTGQTCRIVADGPGQVCRK